MKKLILSLILLSNFSAASEWIHGTWKVDVEALKVSYSEGGKLDDGMAMFLGMLGQGSTTFSDGKIVSIVEEGGPKLPSTFEVLNRTEKQIKIEETTMTGKKRERIFVKLSDKEIKELPQNESDKPTIYQRQF